MARIEDGLSDTQAFALLSETTSTRNTLGLGVWTLRNAAFRATTLDPIMTMLSIGVEKLMKMALGLHHVADHGSWPPYLTYKDVWRHDLTLMNSELLPALRGRLPLATHRPVVEPMLASVEADPAWEPILIALTRFGVSGRFYYLDELAERPQGGENPEVLWDAAERALIASDPEIKTQRDLVSASPAEFDAFLRRLEARMAQAVEDYWKLLSVAGVHGMLGKRGHVWGADVGPELVGRQIRDPN